MLDKGHENQKGLGKGLDWGGPKTSPQRVRKEISLEREPLSPKPEVM